MFYKHKRHFYNFSDKTWQLAKASCTSTKVNMTQSSHTLEYCQDDVLFEKSNVTTPSSCTNYNKGMLKKFRFKYM